MAIVRNMWMRNTRQQVAGAVLYNLKGQTIQREKAANVANPRTTAQMDQRVKLANLVNFYRANKAWMAKGAFETKKQTWSDYNAFVSANIGASKVALTKTQASMGCCVVAPYLVTQGSLPELDVYTRGNNVGISIPSSTAPTTWGALSTAIIAAYPALMNGDQFSIITYIQVEPNDGEPYVRVNQKELFLNTSSTETLATILPDWVADVDGIHTGNDFEGTAVSVCVSRTVAGSIKVSPSKIYFVDDSVYEAYSTDAVYADAVASYGGSSANFLDSNTAGLSNSASESTGGSGAGDPGDVTP